MSRPFGADRAISTMEVIEELIRLAKELDAATKRGENLGLTDDEIAFYDALAANESAVKAMGDDKLKVIAAELITQVRKSVTIDWTLREGARAKMEFDTSPRPSPRSRRRGRKNGKTHPEQTRLPAGSPGGSGEDGAPAGGAAVRGVGVTERGC
jgi:hypothetical protein